MGHVQDNAAESVRRVLERLPDSSRIRVPDRHRPGHQGEDHRRPAKARSDRRLHRHVAGHEEQFQRARTGRPRRGALRLPRHGRGHDPDECGLPAADQHHHPRWLHAEARLSGGRRRRQCRDLAACHQRAVRRHGRHGQRARHDEQPHLRQQAIPVLRDDLLRLAGRPHELGPRLCRHLGRPHPHDQFASHRSGSAGTALPRAARGFPHPRRLWRQGQMGRRRRHQAHHPLPREDGVRDPVLASQSPAARPGRRRRRRGRLDQGPPQGRRHRDA